MEIHVKNFIYISFKILTTTLSYRLNFPIAQLQAEYTVMIVCLFALMIVVVIYCVLSIVVILINIIFVMCDVDYYYYLYSLYVATLCIERDT